MHRAIRHGAAFLLLFVTAATTTSVLSPENPRRIHCSSTYARRKPFSTILIGEWSGFCCGTTIGRVRSEQLLPVLVRFQKCAACAGRSPERQLKKSSYCFQLSDVGVFNSCMADSTCAETQLSHTSLHHCIDFHRWIVLTGFQN